MALDMKESGSMIWLMVKASTSILAERRIKANGRWTNNTDKEKKLGPTNLTSLVTSTWDRSTDREYSNLQTVLSTEANIRKTIFKERASTPGTMAAPTAGNGSIIKCTVKAYSRGKTDADTPVHT